MFLIGILLILNALAATIISGMSLGVILTYGFGGLLILYNINIKTFSLRFLHIVCSVLLVCFVLLFMFGGMLYVQGCKDTVTYEEDVVIVLGTSVDGDKPTATLKGRLDACLKYNDMNPDALIIVTGGMATEVNHSEADVMKNYLTANGISEDLIIIEDRAASTAENFQYSKEITDTLPDCNTLCYITSDFHIKRAGVLAEETGFSEMTHLHGKTSWDMKIPNMLREAVVYLKMMFID